MRSDRIKMLNRVKYSVTKYPVVTGCESNGNTVSLRTGLKAPWHPEWQQPFYPSGGKAL